MSDTHEFEVATNKFTVQIEGFDFKNCSAVSGLDVMTEKLDVQEGAQKQISYRKGRTYAADLVLTRVFKNKNLFSWFKECQQGRVEKRSGSIVCTDDEGQQVATFLLNGCWPIAWSGPVFSTQSAGDIAYETVKLAVEDLDLE
ncbi:MAG: phage tail protein [Bradymonadales bacterium]|nr:MAG: phage tail protein [Bradymonadales bacterium]